MAERAKRDRNNPTPRASSESDYSLMEFMRMFPNDAACLDRLWRDRFAPDGHHAQCLRCKRERKFHRTKTRASYTCDSCGLHIHPQKGTIFEKSSTSLHLWFYAMYLMASTHCGISAKQMEREIGVTYKQAHKMMKRIRTELMTSSGYAGCYLMRIGSIVQGYHGQLSVSARDHSVLSTFSLFGIHSLAGWGDVAQGILAVATAGAVAVAVRQIRAIKIAARRERVYQYADRFNALETLRESAACKEYWRTHRYRDLLALPAAEQVGWLHLPNLLEEVGYLYKRGALDRDVTAELLGPYIERLWEAAEPAMKEMQRVDKNPKLFVFWEKMQQDTWRRRACPPRPVPVRRPADRKTKLVGAGVALIALFGALLDRFRSAP